MNIDDIIEKLRNGETINCEECKKGKYVTKAKDVSSSKSFYCNECGSVVRISPNIIVE